MRRAFRSHLTLLTLAGAITITACDAAAPLGESGSISVRLEPTSLTVDDGDFSSIQVFRKGTFGADSPLPADAVVRWESSDPAIAVVERNGEVHGNAPGATTVAATVTFSNGLSARLTAGVTVRAVPVSIEVLGGDGQTGEVATALPEPVELVVRDRHGNPMPGVEVVFTQVPSTAGGGGAAAGGSTGAASGPLVVATATANAAGTVSRDWVLTPVAGLQQIEPTVPSQDASNRFVAYAAHR